MPQEISRRSFLEWSTNTTLNSALVAAAVAVANTDARSSQQKGTLSGKIKKAVKYNMVQGKMTILEKFKLLKELGFDGVELDSPSGIDRNEVIAARDESGLPIHGVVDSVHWKKPFSHPDPAVRKEGLEGLETALREAKFYGGTSVLLVPAKVDKEISYGEAYERSQVEIRKALPLAGELGIKILLENVWSNFLLSPLEMARYIDELNSPMIGAYFDVGNVVRFGWPEHWIRILGKRIVKIDIKEYSRKKQYEEGLFKGFEVKLLEGDCDWPAVMKALREIGFSGWATAEIPGGDRKYLMDVAERMDRIFAS